MVRVAWLVAPAVPLARRVAEQEVLQGVAAEGPVELEAFRVA